METLKSTNDNNNSSTSSPTSTASTHARMNASQPMDIIQETTSRQPEPRTTLLVQKVTNGPKTQKKKKASYKNVMATMMKGTPEKNMGEAEQTDALSKKGLGGGAFSKVEKI
jgi:hypothetical protein